MGSGSSKQAKPENSMPEPKEAKKAPPRRRGRAQFEEVQLQDPNAAPRNNGQPTANGRATNNGGGYTSATTPAYQNAYDQYSDPSYDGYGQQQGYSNARDMWQRAGNSVQQQQQVVNALTSHPGQDPDEFVAMALQLQEMGDDDIVFETFHHKSGKEYTCIRQGGRRFYLDNWNTHEWQAFPNHWNNQGHFKTDGDPLSGPSGPSNDDPSPRPIRPLDIGDVDVASGLSSEDDRAGMLKHPTRGTILTYIFEEKRNIHCFFDDESGMWVKLPVSWEQHSDFTKPLVKRLRDNIPSWKDKYDMVAALRQSNYDADDAITTYLTIDDTGVMDSPDRLAGFNTKIMKEKDNKISSLEEKMKKLQKNYEKVTSHAKKLHAENTKMKAELEKLRESSSALEVEVKTANMKMVAMQQERPKTAKTVRMAATPDIEAPEADPSPNSHKIDEVPAEPAGPVIDEETLRKLDTTAKSLDKSQVTLKKEVKQNFEDMGKMLQQVITTFSQMKHADTSTNQELDDLKILYKKECLQRRLLYNQLQELRGNIRVFCRVRYDSRVGCYHQFPTEQDISCSNPAGKKVSFQFDRVFTPESKQTEVFQEALPIITSCVDGYNVCIMAYGQTGSGKTYTMMGTKEDPGVNVRAIRELLRICNEREQINYTLKVAMIEVYNEHIQDLLTEEQKGALDVKMKGKRLFLAGLTEVIVQEEEDITKIMDMGDANRSVAATNMNSTSSRSHLLLMLTVEGVDKVSKAVSYGSLTLVDLAGSERIAKTGASGQTLVEAAAINKSLTSLGQVFSGLRSSALHVPYRNSKLTHLLQPSLGGDAKACLFVNVSPAESNVPESISTMQFGSNAKQVQLGQATKNVSKAPKK